MKRPTGRSFTARTGMASTADLRWSTPCLRLAPPLPGEKRSAWASPVPPWLTASLCSSTGWLKKRPSTASMRRRENPCGPPATRPATGTASALTRVRGPCPPSTMAGSTPMELLEFSAAPISKTEKRSGDSTPTPPLSRARISSERPARPWSQEERSSSRLAEQPVSAPAARAAGSSPLTRRPASPSGAPPAMRPGIPPLSSASWLERQGWSASPARAS